MKRFFALCALIVLSTGIVSSARGQATDKSKRPSPAAHAEYQFGDGKTVIVDYSSPRAKGRVVYGGLVPYGAIWRAGANEATTFVTNTDLTVGGKTIPAGSYTIFVIPNKDKWTLIINKKTGEWGTPYPGADSDFARIDMTVSTLPSSLENFTIAFDKNPSGCIMRLDWEATRASIAIKKQ